MVSGPSASVGVGSAITLFAILKEDFQTKKFIVLISRGISHILNIKSVSIKDWVATMIREKLFDTIYPAINWYEDYSQFTILYFFETPP
jgi:hypothetical protein